MEERSDSSFLCDSSLSSELPQLNALLKLSENCKEEKSSCGIQTSPVSGNCILSSVSHNCNSTLVSSTDTSSNFSDSKCFSFEKFTHELSCARISSVDSNNHTRVTSLTIDQSDTVVPDNAMRIAYPCSEENQSLVSSELTRGSGQTKNPPNCLCASSKMLNVVVHDDGMCSRQYMDMSSQCDQRVQCHECTTLPSDMHCTDESEECYYDVVGSEEPISQIFNNNSLDSSSISAVESDGASNLHFDRGIFCPKLASSLTNSRFSCNFPNQVNFPAFQLDSCHRESMSLVHVSQDSCKCDRNHNKQMQLSGEDIAIARRSSSDTSEMSERSISNLKASLPQCVHHSECPNKFCCYGDLCSTHVQLTDDLSSGNELLDSHHAITENVSNQTEDSSKTSHGFHICTGIKSFVENKDKLNVSSNVPKSFLSSVQNFESASSYSLAESNAVCDHNCLRLLSERTISSARSSTISHHVKSPVPGIDDVLFHQKNDHCFEHDCASRKLLDMKLRRNSDVKLSNMTSFDKSLKFQCCQHHRECRSFSSKSIGCKFDCVEHNARCCKVSSNSETFPKLCRSTHMYPGTYNDDRLSTRCTGCHSFKSDRKEPWCRSGNHSCDESTCRDFSTPCHGKFRISGNKWSDAISESSRQIAFQISSDKFSSNSNLQSNHSLKKKVIQKLNRHKFKSPFKESTSSSYQRKTRSASFWMTCMSLASKAGISRSVPSTSRSSWEDNCLGSPCGILPSVPHQEVFIPGSSKPTNRLSSKNSDSVFKIDKCLQKNVCASSLPEHFPLPEFPEKLLTRDALVINESSDFASLKDRICNSDESHCSLNKSDNKLLLTKECNSMLELKTLLEKSLQLKSACPTLLSQKCSPEQEEDKTVNDGTNVPVQAVHTQVDYIHCLVPDLLAITGCSFYWGKMDRYEAENLLNNRPEGTFLLRDSAQTDYLFSVSFRRYGKSLHARVEQGNHKFSFDSHDPDVFASDTVSGLIQHYKDPSCCMFFEPMLTIPLCRSFPFPLQHLCRATICSSTTYDGINKLKLPKVLRNYLKEYHYKQLVRIRRFDQ